MQVAMAGSRRLPEHAALNLARFIAGLNPDEDRLLLRRGIYTTPGPFEMDVFVMATSCRVPVEWRMPVITERTKGRASVYVRDIDMVADADLTVLVFQTDDLDEYSGTAHLFEKCMDLDRVCYAYESFVPPPTYGDPTPLPVFQRWADNDPDDLYREQLP
jgi:hypothetical protein